MVQFPCDQKNKENKMKLAINIIIYQNIKNTSTKQEQDIANFIGSQNQKTTKPSHKKSSIYEF